MDPETSPAVDPLESSRSEAWLAPRSVEFGGVFCRAFSLGSLVLCDRLGMRFRGCGVAEREESCLRWHWSHSAPLDGMLGRVADGSWRDAIAEMDFQPELEESIPGILDYVERTLKLADRLWIDPRPRQVPGGQGKTERPPAGNIPPDMRAVIILDVARELHMREEELWWTMPLPRLLAYWHAARWHHGFWTVGPEAGGDDRSQEVDKALAAVRALRAGFQAEEDPS